jgi:hypothetical protein
LPGTSPKNSTNLLVCNLLLLVPALDAKGIPNTGCSKHFIGHQTPCVNKKPVTSDYIIGLPNGATMAAIHTALLPDDGILPPLSALARRAHVFPTMTNNPLLSIGQFCDDGYDATFTSDAVLLSKQGQTFTIGSRNPVNGLWTVDLSKTNNTTAQTTRAPPLHLPLANNAQTMKTLPDLVRFFIGPVLALSSKRGPRLLTLVFSPLGLDSLPPSSANTFQSQLPRQKGTCARIKKKSDPPRRPPPNPPTNHLLSRHQIS